jgi:hypothetical protein
MLGRVTQCAVALLLPLAAGAQPCFWEHTPAAAIGDFENRFFGIDGTSPTNVWAVGIATYSVPGGSKEYQTLIEHFDGSAWTDAGAPNPGGFTNWHNLADVVAITPDDAYAVGSYVPPTIGSAAQPLALVWDGGSWSHLGAPAYTGGGNFGAAAYIDGEIWATGSRATPFPPPDPINRGFVARWDGSRWRDELLPLHAACGRRGDYIRGIDGVKGSDVWVVGQAEQNTQVSCTRFLIPYVAHYDGSRWQLVGVPVPDPESTRLEDVEAIASDDVWAVGYYSDVASGSHQPYIIHWDGAVWTMADLPPFPAGGAITWSVTARAADDVFAAGVTLDPSGFPSPLILHFDGSGWTAMPIGATNGGNEQFHAIAALRSGDVWAAGLYFNAQAAPLAARLVCGGCYPDCDANSTLDFFDFLCFQNAFLAQDPYADCDENRILDLFDFLCFQNEFLAGCL